MCILDIILIVVTFGSFLAALVNAAFATGGIYIALAASSAVLPLTIAVPLQPVVVGSSLIGRIIYFWSDIKWKIVFAFVCGSVLGVVIGTRVFLAMTDSSLSLVLGFVLLLLIWFPSLDQPQNSGLKKTLSLLKFPFAWVGLIHSTLGTVFGVGMLLQPVVLRMKLSRSEITGTLAACLILLDVLKVGGYVLAGFRYQDYLKLIICATIAGILGTWTGKRLAGGVSDSVFRAVFRLIVSMVAIKLIYSGMAG